LCLLVGTVRADITAWLLGDAETVAARVGYMASEQVEVGVTSYWWPSDDPPQVWGAYGLYIWPDVFEVPNPVSFDWLPEKIKANAYLGAQVGLNLDNDASFAGPIAGLEFEKVFVMEYQFRAVDNDMEQDLNDEHILLWGIRVRF